MPDSTGPTSFPSNKPQMSWMLTDVGALNGTCYMEVLPGRFVGKCWNEQSVYFEEVHFGFIETIIARHVPDYDHYAFLDIDKSRWELIIVDLQSLRQRLENESSPADTRNDGCFPFATKQERLLQNECGNLMSLRRMLDDFIGWMRSTLEKHEAVAVLGM